MVNITFPEIAETKVEKLPPASLDTLKKLREDACSSSSFGFKLQSQQRFLRRVLSPDSPTQNLLLVHGTGSGKTCSAIQIAEEYILRPEFQDKKVLVLANPSIQKNFKDQIFDVSRVNFEDGLLTSKQCTGRRYLDILQRGQRQPIQVSTREQQENIKSKASKIVDEFYEFQGYGKFANILGDEVLNRTHSVDSWIHATFDNRLIIVDEAHNLRETSETNVDSKFISEALNQVIQTAQGVTLVLLTATPMYDGYEEIFDYFNLFLWNSKKQMPKESIHAKDFFNKNGDFLPGKESKFRLLCETYISFVKGENPFTFPFRLPPPEVAKPNLTQDMNGKKMSSQIKYLPLTASIMSPYQASFVEPLKFRAILDHKTICVLPENKEYNEVFEKREGQYFYTGEHFLAPSKIGQYSSKFSLITKILDESKGVAFVYSNLAEMGVQLFAMCLEEHGYSSVSNTLLGDKPEIAKGSKGKYALITSQTPDAEISRILTRLRRKENINGDDIRIVLASPKVSEGVDFRYVRQVHILDPWFNMSRIEQVIGRGMRVCSHSLLPFEQQNTTVYLHVCRYADKKKETLDEYIYRMYAEPKGIAIAKIKKVLMESAMDCELEHAVNALPADWRNLEVPQIRNQDNKELNLSIQSMTSPTFIDDTDLVCHVTESKHIEHERPLSSILDVKDEILDKVLSMFLRKPIWTFADLYGSTEMKQYEPEVVAYIIQNLIESHTSLKDSYGRTGHLEAKQKLVSFSIHENETMQDKILDAEHGEPVPLIEVETKEEVPEFDLNSKLKEYKWSPIASGFSPEVKKWYYVDHILNAAEKRAYLIETESKHNHTESLYIFGPDEIYKNNEKITPIGPDKDEYDEWVKELKEKFALQRESFFAGINEDKKLIFNLDEKSVPIKKVERTKGIGGRACMSYDVGLLNDFMKWLGGSFPAGVKTKADRCMYLDLKVREQILAKKSGLVWYTPEEWAVLFKIKKGIK